MIPMVALNGTIGIQTLPFIPYVLYLYSISPNNQIYNVTKIIFFVDNTILYNKS